VRISVARFRKSGQWITIRSIAPPSTLSPKWHTPGLWRCTKMMKWRVIVRMSLDKDEDRSVHRAVNRILKKHGIFRRTKTGTYESENLLCSDVAWGLQGLIDALQPALVAASNQGVRLDHLWIYVDRGDD
jgi:hypothetical protein